MPLPGGFSKTGDAEDALLQRALLKQARTVERLLGRRRTKRRELRELEAELREAKRFLRGMVQDHGGRP